MRKRIIVILTSIILIGVSLVGLIYAGYIRFNYLFSIEFPIQGIDVSHHQKEIEWNKINKNDVRFVFIKATEGGDFKDKKFEFNWKESKKNKFNVGAYHFFTFCKSGREQAKNFIETVPVEKGSLPPVINIELEGNCKIKKDKKEIHAEIDTLQQLLQQNYLKKPIFYVTEDFYNEFLVDKFSDNPIWFRDIYKKPNLKGNRKWLFWQYGDSGHLEGINTDVDLNVFNGSEKEFKKLIE
jgi:lysozyme